jgi:type II secretory pathway component HofQ
MRLLLSVVLGCSGLLFVACHHSAAASDSAPDRLNTAPAPSMDGGTAKTIDLSLDGVHLHDAARAISAQAGVNFSVDPDLDDAVTFHAQSIPWDEALEELARRYKFRVVRAGPVLWLTRSPDAPREYTGAPMEVSFADTPIAEVANTFSAFAGVPIIVDEGVQALVTQRSRNLPWDFLLEHIARKYGLQIVRAGGALRIAKGAGAPPAKDP